MRISNSQAKSYLRCRRQYDYKYKQLLTTRRGGLPLKRGLWLHDLLEAHYNGNSWRAVHARWTAEFMTMFEEEREYYGDLPQIIEDIMRSYLYWWRDEEEDWEVLATEQKFEAELPNGNMFIFKVDAIIEDEFGRWLLEHKSHKTIPNDTYRFIDVQSARYVWALNELGWNLDGVIWNYIRTKQPSVPKLTKAGNLSKAKCDTDLFTFVRALKTYGLNPRDHRDKIKALKEHNNFFRRERVPKPPQVIETLVSEIDEIADEIERGFTPIRTIDRNCIHMCDFTELCMTELYGGDAKQVRRTQYRTADEADYYALEGLIADARL